MKVDRAVGLVLDGARRRRGSPPSSVQAEPVVDSRTIEAPGSAAARSRKPRVAERSEGAPLSDCDCHIEAESSEQARTLWVLLGINAAMFIGEFGAGMIAESTALLADSLDMLADAVVYGVSLYAVARSARSRALGAALSGWLQMGLGAFVLVDVARRVLAGSDPEPRFMIVVSVVALIANAACLRLIARHREGGVHMRASYIFSQNDVIANCAVIVSGVLVAATGWAAWDLAAGAGIAGVVSWGGVRIIRDARRALDDATRSTTPDVA